MFFFKKKKAQEKETYDASALKPAIRSSICTGEKTVGFIDKKTGQYREYMLVRSEADVEDFKSRYGITGEIETIY